MKSISRRQFFKGSTGIAGAAALMPFAQAQQIPPHCQNVPTKWDFTADVVVVGAGACGMASAIRAADAGADILVVDTNYDIGGHAIFTAVPCIRRRNSAAEENTVSKTIRKLISRI